MKNQLHSIFPSASQFTEEEAEHLIFENIEDFFIVLDSNYNIVFANDTVKAEIKKRLSINVVPGMSILKFAAPNRVSILKKLYDDVLSGNRRTSESSFKNSDGSICYYEHKFIPAKNSSDQIIGIVVASRDITEKKKAEKSLKESEERWRFALEGSNQGVWDLNIDTGEVYYSASYLKMYGYEQNEIKNHISDWEDRIHPDDKERVNTEMEEHIAMLLPQFESTYRIKNKAGEYKWILAKGMLIKQGEGEPRRMIGIHIDLSDSIYTEEVLKRTNQEIKIANERFNIMMKATHDMIWDWDIVNNCFYRGEEGLLKVYGVQHNESIQTFNQWLSRIHLDDLNKVESVINEILQATDNDTFDLEYRFIRDDGSYSYVYDRGMIIRNEQGEPIRMIGAAQDISERKKLEAEILRNELAHQKHINQATIDSQEQERTEISKELHDNVNQVLTTTKLYLDLALTSSDLKEDLVKKSIKNIVSVINEIRQLSRSLMDPSIDDLGIIDSMKDLIENINLTKKIHVVFNVDPTIEDKLSKSQKLTIFRIVQESLSNVMRHAKATDVLITLSYVHSFAELVIEDNGIGFNPYLVKKGAGLKNIQNRVYLINGTHFIKSQPGKGCKLKIKFPIHINEN